MQAKISLYLQVQQDWRCSQIKRLLGGAQVVLGEVLEVGESLQAEGKVHADSAQRSLRL